MEQPLTSAEQGGRCRRHPRHRQSTGVCPYCLRECLSRLPHHHRHSSTTAYLTSSSVSSSPCSSDDDAELSSSEDSSPIHRHGPKSTARVSFLFRREIISSVASGLTRSQSLIFFEADGRKGEEEEEKGKKKEETEKTRKKEKVWWKLMSGSRRWWNYKKESHRVANLMHSQTFKEKPSAKWVLFA